MTGKELRDIREALGIKSMKMLGSITGYSYSQIQRMETGKQKVSKKVENHITMLHNDNVVIITKKNPTGER